MSLKEKCGNVEYVWNNFKNVKFKLFFCDYSSTLQAGGKRFDPAQLHHSISSISKKSLRKFKKQLIHFNTPEYPYLPLKTPHQMWNLCGALKT